MTQSKHPIPEELLDQLLANYQKPEDLIGADGILKQLTKKLVERALDAELTHHLGHDRHQPVSNPVGNTRNGFSSKKLKGEFGELPIEVPRDRHGTFDPQIVEKHQTRWGRLRRQAPLAVCPRHDGARDPGALAGDVRCRGVAQPDFLGDRCRSR